MNRLRKQKIQGMSKKRMIIMIIGTTIGSNQDQRALLISGFHDLKEFQNSEKPIGKREGWIMFSPLATSWVFLLIKESNFFNKQQELLAIAHTPPHSASKCCKSREKSSDFLPIVAKEDSKEAVRFLAVSAL